MTFQKAEQIFKTKYPDGEMIMHGKMGGTEKNKKISVRFKSTGRSYEYYGAYEDVLCRCGINVVSKERFDEVKHRLARLESEHGQPSGFGDIFDDDIFDDDIIDWSAEIAECKAMIDKYEKDYIIA